MSRPVSRQEILDYETYEEQRSAARERMLAVKAPRRIHLGEYLTFLFENTDTMRYQIQEMIRVERLVKESSIRHEIETYNALLGGKGELACSLLIGITDAGRRKELLTAWRDLPRHLYLRLEDGERAYARFDPEQVGEDRLSAVQYLVFPTGGRAPVAVGTDFPPLDGEVELTPEQRRALEEDLAS